MSERSDKKKKSRKGLKKVFVVIILASALLLEGRMGFRAQVREALARRMMPMPEPDLRASDSLPKAPGSSFEP